MDPLFLRILRDIEELASVKTKYRLEPKLCAKCGVLRERANFHKFGTADFLQLHGHFAVSGDLDNLDPQIFSDFDLWKCSRGSGFAKCKTLHFSWLSTLQAKYHVQIPSTAATTVTDTLEPAHSTRSTKPKPVCSPDPYFDTGVCLMDSNFLSKFKCTYCKEWLELKNMQSFTIDKLWGVAKIYCGSCDFVVEIETVKDKCATRRTFHASVDVCGMVVSKAENLFLANNLLPPHCNRAGKKISEEIETAAFKVAEGSVNRVMRDEPLLPDGGICVRGDFGWHNRAHNNAQSGK